MQYSFFNEEARMEKLTKMGDPLEQLNRIVNWGIFTPILDNANQELKESW